VRRPAPKLDDVALRIRYKAQQTEICT